MSWKRMPDRNEKREAYLREIRERHAPQRRTEPSTPAPRWWGYHPRWLVALALASVAVWLLL